MLYYTNTRKYCGKEANLQVTDCCIMFADLNEVLFPRTWLSLSKSEPAKPTRILLVELTVRWDTANNFVKKDRKV